MRLVGPDETYVAVLGRFAGDLYTPETHNRMRAALADAGIAGDLDQIIRAFANVDSRTANHIEDKASALR